MSDTSFVRTEMLPEQAPPATSIGAVGWIRANLFPNATNSILTVLALAFIVYVLAGLIPWVFQSESGYDSLTNCREVFLSTAKPMGTPAGRSFPNVGFSCFTASIQRIPIGDRTYRWLC